MVSISVVHEHRTQSLWKIACLILNQLSLLLFVNNCCREALGTLLQITKQAQLCLVFITEVWEGLLCYQTILS